MKPILLTDLDDTLFQTARKMSPAEPKLLVAKGADGQALSFLSLAASFHRLGFATDDRYSSHCPRD